MTTSKRISKPRSRISSRSPDAAKALILDVNNIQGRYLRNVLPVNIRNIRTVRQLKKAIATHHNLTVRELLYRGVSVGDDRQLAHLLPTMTKIGHSPRFSVRTSFIAPPKPDDMILIVKYLTGKTLEVNLPPQSTLGDLKDAVEDVGGIPVSQTGLLSLEQKNLWEFEDDLPLASLNLVTGSVLHYVLLLRGGGAFESPFRSFVDMENTSSLKTCKLAGHPDDTRPWRNVYRGLNIQGKCQNLKCKAYGCDVYCQKRFTVFNIAEPVTCPSCKEQFTAVTCGFWGCEWMFEGRKLMSGIDIMSRWNVTGDEEFQWFDDRGGRNTTDWSSLVITAKPLVSSRFRVEDCALCFGSLHVWNPQSGITKKGTCGHAMHAGCARAFVRAGYSNCPTCRLPLGSGTQDRC